ncbi:MAG TPA: permease [Micromonosporaceae bacterium]
MGSVEALAAVIVVAILARGWLLELLDSPRMLTFITVFVSIMVQAIPFLVLGTLLSAAITAFVPARFFERALPRHPAAAVPVAGVAGVVLPACECGSVPVAGALIRRGVPPAAAFAFLLSSPAINPVVLIATAVAFPNQPSMVVARFGASLLVAVIMGWLWLRLGQPEWLRPVRVADPHTGRGWSAFWSSCRHDLVQAGGFLAIGALAAAVLNVTMPPRWLEAIAANPVFSVIALALLAVLLSICSEADAFVAASLSQFSLTARLAFLVVGPMVDLKLFAMQAGTFGPRFAVRFAPATFVVGVLVAVVVGWVMF